MNVHLLTGGCSDRSKPCRAGIAGGVAKTRTGSAKPATVDGALLHRVVLTETVEAVYTAGMTPCDVGTLAVDGDDHA